MNNELDQPVGWPVDVAAAEPPPTTPMIGRTCRLEVLDADAHGDSLYREYSAAQDDADWTYLPYGPFTDAESFLDWLRSVQGRPDPLFFTVLEQEGGSAVGLASYLRISSYAASIEVGHIHFSRRLQHTPAATEAMYLMMQRAFLGGYRRYEWKCDDLNAPSRAAAQRLGFTYEGTFRQATHYKGRNRDTAWFGITDAEWPAIEAAFVSWLAPNNFDADGNQRTSLTTP